MRILGQCGWRHAIAGVFGLVASSAALSQPPQVSVPGSTPPPASPEVVQLPLSSLPNPTVPVGAANSTPERVGGALPMSGTSYPMYVPGGTQPTAPVGAASSMPDRFGGVMPRSGTPYPMYVPIGAQAAPGGAQPPPPLMSSQPPPFQVAPDAAPAATNDQNFFSGHPPVQDLSHLLAGRFQNTKYKWYGFVRLDGIYDFHPMGTTDAFVTSAIPIPQGSGDNAVLTPRYTRIGFDTETPLTNWDWTLKTRIELDFYNGFSSGAFGSFPLRLRFAWADFGPFLIGQAASLFMDYDVFPNVLDYEGPGGMVLMRQPVFAYRCPIGDRMKVSIGIEQPYSDIQWLENGVWVRNPGNGIITNPSVGRNIQNVPDVTANIRYKGDYGHVQVAAIARRLAFQPAFASTFSELGYGGNVTGTYHPWAAFSNTPTSGECATPLSKSRFLAQAAAGVGINRYIQDVNGLGLDATFDPGNGFRAIPAYGWFAAYEHWWTDKWISNFTYGENASELTDTLPGNTYWRANYVSANIIWLPIERMGVGLEGLYGFRKNKDGGRGENTRIQMGFQYRF